MVIQTTLINCILNNYIKLVNFIKLVNCMEMQTQFLPFNSEIVLLIAYIQDNSIKFFGMEVLQLTSIVCIGSWNFKNIHEILKVHVNILSFALRDQKTLICDIQTCFLIVVAYVLSYINIFTVSCHFYFAVMYVHDQRTCDIIDVHCTHDYVVLYELYLPV